MTTAEFETLQKEILSKGQRLSELKWFYNDYILIFSEFGMMTRIKTPGGKTFIYNINDFDFDSIEEE